MLSSLLLSLIALQTDFPEKPDVLMVVFDDVAERDIDRIPTPTFDALAERGVRFTRAYGAPTCSPARRMLHFGTYWTADSGDPCGGSSKPNDPSVADLSLPKLFEGANYRTALFGKWHLGGWPGMDVGAPWELAAQAHGYEVWRAGIGSNVKNPVCPGPIGSYSDWIRVEDGVSFRSSEYQTHAVRDSFLTWHASLPPDEPWFAVVAFQAPHSPFHIPKGLPQGQILLPRDRYELMLTSADQALSRILSVVNPDRTLVIVVGDNGTPPSVVHRTQNASKAKSTTYEDGIRVPMVWAGPGIAKGAQMDGVVSFVDVLPTLADMLGIDTSPRLDRDGVSLIPSLRDPSRDARLFAFSGLTNPSNSDLSVVTRRWKLRHVNGVPFLFDLMTDPKEQVNLAGKPGFAEIENRLFGWILEHTP